MESNERQGSEQELTQVGAHSWEGSVCWSGQARLEKDDNEKRRSTVASNEQARISVALESDFDIDLQPLSRAWLGPR